MPELVNKLDHPVRADDENGESVRVVPGQVVSVEGLVADRLSSYEGVETASGEDKEAWDAQRALRMGEAPSTKLAMEEHYSGLRIAGRVATVAVPLNEVIGDDDAPMGPPSGTITTKQAVAREGGFEKRAFADHERLPEEASNEKLSDIELAQAEAKALVEELHNEALERAAEAGSESATTEGSSEGSLSSEGQGKPVTGEREAEQRSQTQAAQQTAPLPAKKRGKPAPEQQA